MTVELELSRESSMEETHVPHVQSSLNPVSSVVGMERGESKESGSKSSKSELGLGQIVDVLSNLKLNPMAKEFIPSAYLIDQSRDQFVMVLENEGLPINRRRKNRYNNGRKMNGRVLNAQREDNVRRTIYVSDLDQHVTEERLADLFGQNCGPVADCRICGDPNSRLRFAFVEFENERCARYALNLSGTIIGFYPIKVLPSKTAILPVNPTFLPRSEDEKEMCARTVYCTNIDKTVSQIDVNNFFESSCGQVSRLRLLGDNAHSTRIAFVEFVMAESAIEALNLSGRVLGTQAIRISPSKTPVRPQMVGNHKTQNEYIGHSENSNLW